MNDEENPLFQEILNHLDSLSLFELWRIECTIRQKRENPQKRADVLRALKVGMEITYFEESENRLVEATLMEIRKTRVLVVNKHDGQRWVLPFYMLNVESIPIEEPPHRGQYGREHFSLSDHVGWISPRDGKEWFGTIIKLNPKKAKVKRLDGQVWNVPYSMLYPVLDGEMDKSSCTLLIEAQ